MKRFTAALLLAAYPSVALADLKHVPMWTRKGNDACYDLDGAKKLLALDDDFDTCLKTKALNIDTIASLQTENQKLHVALSLSEISLNAEKTNSTVLTDDLKKCNEDKAKAASETSWGWTVAGGVGLVLGGVLLGWYVIKK